MTIFLIVPLVLLISEAFRNGVEVFKDAVLDKYTIKAMQLTITATVISVAINMIFGLFAAWSITKFNFKGKKLLLTMIDIPFSVSPVIAGLVLVLTFGRIG